MSAFLYYISALLAQAAPADPADLRRVYREQFENPGPPSPYAGWQTLVDELHRPYNRADRYPWAMERRVRLIDGAELLGSIRAESPAEVELLLTDGSVRRLARAGIVSIREDDSRRPRSLRHAVSVRAYKGAGAYQTVLGDLLDAARRPLPVDPSYTYRLKVHARILEGRLNGASASLRWLDAAGTLVGEDRSAPLRVAADWTPLTLEVPHVDPRAEFVQIVLSLEGPDPRAECLFDDVELVAQPRIHIAAPDRPYLIYAEGETVEADLSFGEGVPAGLALKAQAFDLWDKVQSEALTVGSGDASDRAPARLRFVPPAPGYYEIRASVGTVSDATMPVLVLGRPPFGAGGLLGLTINPYTTPADRLPYLFDRLELRKLKLVLWDRGTPRGGRRPTLDSLARLADAIWLLPRAPEVIGVLDRGPEELFPALSAGLVHGHPLLLFGQPPAEWSDPVGATLARLNRINRWQIGGDFGEALLPPAGADEAFAAATAAIRRGDRSYSQVGLAVRSREERPPPAGADFLAYRIESVEPLERWRVRLKGGSVQEGPILHQDKDFVTVGGPDGTSGAIGRAEIEAVEPLFTAPQAADHLVLALPPDDPARHRAEGVARLLTSIVRARARGDLPAEIYLPLEPLDGRGLLTAEGLPRPALAALPVLDAVLGGAEPDAALRLFDAEGVREEVFTAGGRAVVAAWTASRPHQQVVYLGDEARIVDAFGKVTLPERGRPIELTTLPTYLVNVDRDLLRTQSSVAFSPEQVRQQRRETEVELTFINHFSSPMRNVRISLSASEPGWFITPRALAPIDEVAPGKEAPRQKVRLQPPVAPPGSIRVAMAFRVGEYDHTFTVNRRLRFVKLVEAIVRLRPGGGGTDVEVVVKDHSKDGRVVQVDVDLPDQPRRRSVVAVQGGQESFPLLFRIPDAARVAGRAVEVSVREPDGSRAFDTVTKILGE